MTSVARYLAGAAVAVAIMLGLHALASGGWSVPPPSDSFTGDLNGSDLEDSSDNTVDIAASDKLCGKNASCVDLHTDDKMILDNAATGSNTFIVQMGTHNTAVELASDGASRFLDVSTVDDNRAGIKSGTIIVEDAIEGNDMIQMTTGGALGMRSSGTGLGQICWSDDASGSIDCGVYLGSTIVSATEKWIGPNGNATWSTTAPGSAALRMGDMDTTSRARTACDLNVSGIINYDYDVADDDDGGLMDACVQENTGGATSYAWRSVVDAYAEIKWHDNSTATTVSSCNATDWSNEVAVAGGAVDESAGFDTSGAVLTLQTSSAGRWEGRVAISFVGGTGDTYEFALKCDDGVTPAYVCNLERTMGATALTGSAAGSCIFDVGDDDTIALYVQQTNSGCNNVTVSEGSVVLRRL